MFALTGEIDDRKWKLRKVEFKLVFNTIALWWTFGAFQNQYIIGEKNKQKL